MQQRSDFCGHNTISNVSSIAALSIDDRSWISFHKGPTMLVLIKGIKSVTPVFVGTVLGALGVALPGPARHLLASAGAVRPNLSGHLTLAARVQHILGIQPGDASYLPSVAKLVKVVAPYVFQPHPRHAIYAALAQRSADIRQLVAALNAGANPNALRTKILQSVNLEGRYVPLKGKHWRYGILGDRMWIAAYIQNHALELMRAGNAVQAAHYARASLLLRCQESPAMGWYYPLLYYVHTGAERLRVKEDGPLTRKIQMIPASLAITVAQQQELNGLFRTASLRGGKRFRRLYNSLDIAANVVGRTRRPFDRKIVRNYLKILQQSISAAPSIHWRYEILVNTMVALRRLNLSGHRGTSEKIEAVFQQWTARVKANETMEPVAKEALLRWLKEALPP